MGRLEKYILVTIVTAAIFFFIWYFSNIVMYVIISFILSLMGKPLMDLLSRIKYKNKLLPRWFCATTVIVVIITVFIMFINLIVPVMYEKFSFYTNNHLGDLKSIVDKPMQRINEFVNVYSDGDLNFNLDYIISQISERFTILATNIFKNIGSIIDYGVHIIIGAFSVFFITFFFLKEDNLFLNAFSSLFPSKFEEKVRESFTSSISLLSKYFLALLMESTVKFIIISMGFYIYGLDFASSLIIGFISAVLNVIPYIGPLIGAMIGIFLAIIAYNGDIEGLIFFSAAIFSIFQIIDNIIIQPFVYSTSVKAHPLEIFLVILLAGASAGVTGMLFAIPAYTILRVFARTFFIDLRLVRKLTDSMDS